MGTHPTDPKMWLSLSDMKFVHRSGKTKRFTVPRFVDVLSNKWTQQYMKRSPDKHHLSMLQLHCICVMSAEDCHFSTKSERGMQNGVALEHRISLATHSHQRALWHLPRSLAYRFRASARFAAALCCCSACEPPQLWTCNDAIEQVLHRRSLKKHQIATYLSFVQTLHDTYNC